MSVGSADARESERASGGRRWCALILLLSLLVNMIGLQWGLPNDNQTWAADALQPLTPMSVGRHVLFGERWNSGWFYFKYPLGHPLLLLAAQAPYLAWLRATGQLGRPASTYPYGFKQPERALARLALTTRAVSALMGVGTVGLAYVIGTSLFGVSAGLVSALLVAGCYPLVFYAHTSNVDAPLLFWIALALAAALRSAERDSRAAALLAGGAMAMALLTKEQSIGALAAVPPVWLLQRRARQTTRRALQHAVAALAGFAAVTFVIGNVWWNPAGYVNRWRFLLGVLPAAIREKYAPYQFLVQVPQGFSLAHEWQHVGKVAGMITQALTPPVMVLSLAGLALALWRRPRSGVVLLVLGALYYLLSLRALELVPVRYTMPVLFAFLLAGGAMGGVILDWIGAAPSAGRRRALSAAVVLALLGTLLPGVEVVHLLRRDPRYAAEAWLRANAGANARVEVYQPMTYLPRFTSEAQVTRVPVPERTIEAFQQRHPDLVVLSGGGRAGLTGRYAKDWRPGQPIFADSDQATQFFDALRGERLGYQRAAQFRTPTRWITPRINSVNPEITIFTPSKR